MVSNQLTALLARAVSNKGKALLGYEKLLASITDPKMKEILSGIVQHEQRHLEMLSSVLSQLADEDDQGGRVARSEESDDQELTEVPLERPTVVFGEEGFKVNMVQEVDSADPPEVVEAGETKSSDPPDILEAETESPEPPDVLQAEETESPDPPDAVVPEETGPIGVPEFLLKKKDSPKRALRNSDLKLIQTLLNSAIKTLKSSKTPASPNTVPPVPEPESVTQLETESDTEDHTQKPPAVEGSPPEPGRLPEEGQPEKPPIAQPKKQPEIIVWKGF
ncbi:MAG: hypothetical protein RDU41_10080 [Clostridia bacterium]|nr:hypothetical protein [Clostridia bacterium]